MTGPGPDQALAGAFEQQRGRLVAVAYRMLGSRADAEDAVQEAWLRLARQDAAAIDNLAGWLTTVVGRVCIDVLRSRKARPEASYDDRLPELVVTEDGGERPRMTRCSPNRSGWHCWWCSIPSAPPSGWRSCCTTCSRCRSRRSVRSSAGPRTLRRCSPAGPVGRYRTRPVRPMNGSSSARWSMRFSRQRGAETSKGCCGCSTRT